MFTLLIYTLEGELAFVFFWLETGMAEKYEIDEYGKDKDGIFRSHEPIYDGVGIRCINFLLFGFYILLFAVSVTGIVLPCVFPNTPIPIIITFAIVIVVTALHAAVKIIGKVCIKGYLLYPIKPKWIYQVADGALVFTVVAVIAAFILDIVVGSGPRIIMPMIGSWTAALVMLINFHLVWRITYEGPTAPPPVVFVEREEEEEE
jgi:hypothetical protein